MAVRSRTPALAPPLAPASLQATATLMTWRATGAWCWTTSQTAARPTWSRQGGGGRAQALGGQEGFVSLKRVGLHPAWPEAAGPHLAALLQLQPGGPAASMHACCMDGLAGSLQRPLWLPAPRAGPHRLAMSACNALSLPSRPAHSPACALPARRSRTPTGGPPCMPSGTPGWMSASTSFRPTACARWG